MTLDFCIDLNFFNGQEDSISENRICDRVNPVNFQTFWCSVNDLTFDCKACTTKITVYRYLNVCLGLREPWKVIFYESYK